MKQILAILFLGIYFSVACSPKPEAPPYDWRADWEIENGFRIEHDASGFQFPTAMAFVPNPGSEAQDPLYFVTEIAGRVKVVTNDRRVHTFADGFSRLSREIELPDSAAQMGTAGICLEPQHGYVFVTLFTQDEEGIYRNRIVRFETTPGKFAIAPRRQVVLDSPFSADHLARSGHHIGPCDIKDDLLYVGIGDSQQVKKSQEVDALLGKIARMTFDGLPPPENPFRVDADPRKPRNFVWAYGLRNPYGLKIVRDQIFVADNGNDVDRFMHARVGKNYLWDGTDWSIGAGADAIFVPSIAPAHLDYLKASGLFPSDYSERFYLAGAAYYDDKRSGIVTLQYNFADPGMQSPPRYFLRYRGDGQQAIAGFAFGTDALYIVPLLPDGAGSTTILRVTYDPAHAHPFALGSEKSYIDIVHIKGCFGCHSVDGSINRQAPGLDAPALVARLNARLDSDAYRERLRALDQREDEPYKNYRAARQKILQAHGKERLQLWVENFLQEPRFDNPDVRMPNQNLSPQQAQIVAEVLIREPDGPFLKTWYQIVPVLQAHLLIYGAICFLAGGIIFYAAMRFRQRRRRA